MEPRRRSGLPAALIVTLALYCLASLLHFAHNAEFAAEYPNLPASLTRGTIYGAWLGIASIGAVGCLLLWRGYQIAGLAVIALYAALGFDGLLHYDLAPVSAHSGMMNFTIWLEVAAAAALLAVVAARMVRRLRKA